uniref:Uncharacterized protein n=1 Tax=Steinernema glaseri TaxID=37863 RepID=A0A1I7ZEL1_9BILA
MWAKGCAIEKPLDSRLKIGYHYTPTHRRAALFGIRSILLLVVTAKTEEHHQSEASTTTSPRATVEGAKTQKFSRDSDKKELLSGRE